MTSISPKISPTDSPFAELHTGNGGGLPKHLRLTNVLIDVIQSGVWKAGEKLPSEEEIVTLTPYSLGTVQRALRNLTEQGLIVRQHGIGSFVAETAKKVREPWHCRFLDDDNRSFLPLYTQALSRQQIDHQGPWTQYLGTSARIMQLDRIINVNKEFDIYGKFYADIDILQHLWEMPLASLNGLNLKEVIISEYKLPITDVVHLITLTAFETAICDALNIGPASQGLLVKAIAHTGKAQCVYYQEYYIPPTRRVLAFPETTV